MASSHIVVPGTLCKESESGIFSIFWGNVNSQISSGHRQNWEHCQNQAPDWAQSGLIGPDHNPDSPKSGLESGLMEIAKIMSPHQHITIKAHHWDSVKSASAIAHFIISLLSIAVRDIVVLMFTIIWFIWASTVQQQRTIFWHRG
jgi:hypothetical protein